MLHASVLILTLRDCGIAKYTGTAGTRDCLLMNPAEPRQSQSSKLRRATLRDELLPSGERTL